jgi:hypothetical protein
MVASADYFLNPVLIRISDFKSGFNPDLESGFNQISDFNPDFKSAFNPNFGFRIRILSRFRISNPD